MVPTDNLADAREVSLAAVALRAEAMRRGGFVAATPKELHALVPAGPDWPQSGAELAARVLPILAARPGYRGVTVRKAGRDLWEVVASIPPGGGGNHIRRAA